MHQCSKNAKLGKVVELGGEATCLPKRDMFITSNHQYHIAVPHFISSQDRLKVAQLKEYKDNCVYEVVYW